MNLKSYVSSIDLIRKIIIFSNGVIYIILAYLLIGLFRHLFKCNDFCIFSVISVNVRKSLR